VQTLVPVMLDHVNAGRLSLARFVDLTSAGPARLYKHRGQGPASRPAHDADFTIVDLKRSETITTNGRLRAGWTPYDGVRVTAGRSARCARAPRDVAG